MMLSVSLALTVNREASALPLSLPAAPLRWGPLQPRGDLLLFRIWPMTRSAPSCYLMAGGDGVMATFQHLLSPPDLPLLAFWPLQGGLPQRA